VQIQNAALAAIVVDLGRGDFSGAVKDAAQILRERLHRSS
jgi:hypothetical protein